MAPKYELLSWIRSPTVVLFYIINLITNALFGYSENPQITPAAQGGAAGSARLLLTKNPVCPGVSFERSSRPQQTTIALKTE